MVVVFVGSTDKADQLVAAGVAVKGEHTPVFPLSNPAKKVAVSNVPPFFNSSRVQVPAAEPCGVLQTAGVHGPQRQQGRAQTGSSLQVG